MVVLYNYYDAEIMKYVNSIQLPLFFDRLVHTVFFELIESKLIIQNGIYNAFYKFKVYYNFVILVKI